MNRKSLAWILAVVFCLLFSSCGTREKAPQLVFDGGFRISQENGNFCLDALGWGLTEPELMGELKLTEKQIIVTDVFSHKRKIIMPRMGSTPVEDFPDCGLQMSYTITERDNFARVDGYVYFNATPYWIGDNLTLKITEMTAEEAQAKAEAILKTFEDRFGPAEIKGNMDGIMATGEHSVFQWQSANGGGGLSMNFYHEADSIYATKDPNGYKDVYGCSIFVSGQKEPA